MRRRRDRKQDKEWAWGKKIGSRVGIFFCYILMLLGVALFQVGCECHNQHPNFLSCATNVGESLKKGDTNGMGEVADTTVQLGAVVVSGFDALMGSLFKWLGGLCILLGFICLNILRKKAYHIEKGSAKSRFRGA